MSTEYCVKNIGSIRPAVQLRWLVVIWALLASGCATFHPAPLEEISFVHRAETKSKDGISVSVVVLSPEESEQAFGAPLAGKGIQPVWLRIENSTDKEYLLLENNVDRSYFSPHEAAWKSHYFASGEANRAMNRYFVDQHIPLYIAPHRTVSGFVYTNLDEGIKYVAVDLLGLGAREYKSFWFVAEVPGLEADYKLVDWDNLYPEEEIVDFHDDQELRAWLEAQPCCTLGGDEETPADPLNLVVIGNPGKTITGFVLRGWDVTETLHLGSLWVMIQSSLFGGRYRTSPVSPLYLFGRSQDIALQKARASVDERNHLRLWLAPVRYQGMNVHVGQISRDIGIRLAAKTLVTHKIDPAVDEARTYLALDLLASERLAAYGYVKGAGAAPLDDPRHNYTGDPYYTDGRRLVLIMADDRTDMLDLERLDWEPPLMPKSPPAETVKGPGDVGTE